MADIRRYFLMHPACARACGFSTFIRSEGDAGGKDGDTCAVCLCEGHLALVGPLRNSELNRALKANPGIAVKQIHARGAELIERRRSEQQASRERLAMKLAERSNAINVLKLVAKYGGVSARGFDYGIRLVDNEELAKAITRMIRRADETDAAESHLGRESAEVGEGK